PRASRPPVSRDSFTLPVRASQRLIPPDISGSANCLPSGLKARLRRPVLEGFRSATLAPVLASQAIAPLPEVTRYLPSGLKTALVEGSVVREYTQSSHRRLT